MMICELTQVPLTFTAINNFWFPPYIPLSVYSTSKAINDPHNKSHEICITFNPLSFSKAYLYIMTIRLLSCVLEILMLPSNEIHKWNFIQISQYWWFNLYKHNICLQYVMIQRLSNKRPIFIPIRGPFLNHNKYLISSK